MHSHFDQDSLSAEPSNFYCLEFQVIYIIAIKYLSNYCGKFFQGEQLGTTEATETFFAMTKLFQSRDVILRRMVYLGIKELSSIAEDVIIVTSSLTKDMTGKEDLYRAAAIRALCSITDVSVHSSDLIFIE